MLIGISTPYRKVGLLFNKHRDHFGQDSDDVLVVQGESAKFNPTLNQSAIDAAIAADPEGMRAEWEATLPLRPRRLLGRSNDRRGRYRSRPLELPPRADHVYYGFVDPSGGRHDAYTLAVAHCEGELTVIDLVRATRPPFDPHEVTKDYAALCREYGIDEIHGDRYSAEWVSQAFQKAEITYTPSEKNKSDIYLEDASVIHTRRYQHPRSRTVAARASLARAPHPQGRPRRNRSSS